jgi:hypothetical protein
LLKDNEMHLDTILGLVYRGVLFVLGIMTIILNIISVMDSFESYLSRFVFCGSSVLLCYIIIYCILRSIRTIRDQRLGLELIPWRCSNIDIFTYFYYTAFVANFALTIVFPLYDILTISSIPDIIVTTMAMHLCFNVVYVITFIAIISVSIINPRLEPPVVPLAGGAT